MHSIAGLYFAYIELFMLLCPTGDCTTVFWNAKNDDTGMTFYKKGDISKLTDPEHVRTVTEVQNKGHAYMALAVHNKHQILYYTDGDMNSLNAVDMEQITGSLSGARRLGGLSNQVFGLSMDWINDNLYWTDAIYNRISIVKQANLRNAKILIKNLDKPYGISVHPTQGFLFWVNSGKNPSIERSDLAGESRTILYNGEDIKKPLYICIDVKKNYVYWTDEDRIHRMGLDGSNYEIFIRRVKVQFKGIDILDTYLFVTEESSGELRIYDTLDRTYEEKIPERNVKTFFDLEIDDISKQIRTTSPCQISDCIQLCVSTNDNSDPKCLCREGYDLEPDGTCKKSKLKTTGIYIMTSGDSLLQLYENYVFRDDDPTKAYLWEKGLSNAQALTYHYTRGYLYFADNGKNIIYRAKLTEGAVPQELSSDIKNVQAMDVDWIDNKLYWTDSGKGTITRTELDGTDVSVIIKDLVNVTGIAVDAVKRNLYFGVSGSNPSIKRLNLNSSQVSDMFSIRSGTVNQLLLDIRKERLYWTNSEEHTINSVNLNGLDHKVLVTIPGQRPHGISIFQELLAWTALNDSTGVHFVLKGEDNPAELKTFLHSEPIYDIIMYSDYLQPTISQAKPGPPTEKDMLPIYIGVAAGVLIIIIIIIIVVVVLAKHRKKRNADSTEEVYDQIDESELTSRSKRPPSNQDIYQLSRTEDTGPDEKDTYLTTPAMADAKRPGNDYTHPPGGNGHNLNSTVSPPSCNGHRISQGQVNGAYQDYIPSGGSTHAYEDFNKMT